MHAGDLILVSESRFGLQNSLKKLQIYCVAKWKLKVNTKNQNNEDWEKAISPICGAFFIWRNTNWRMQVLRHTYLGTVISSNNSAKLLPSRAMYTLFSHTDKYSGENIKLHMDLLDKIIVSICTYNCEVWGSAFFTKQSSRHTVR